MEKINIRSLPTGQRAFDALPMERRQAIVAQDDVKEFLTRFRELGKTRAAIQGGELTIPIVFLDLIAENMFRYSKLLNRVRVRNVRGEARQTIAGLAPEAIWTEMCGAINELTFQFNQITVDGYKVAGYIPVCNSLLEDSDVDLASWIVEMLSESLGYAKDKAILYGTGSKMPMGIVTRLRRIPNPQTILQMLLLGLICLIPTLLRWMEPHSAVLSFGRRLPLLRAIRLLGTAAADSSGP